MHPTGAVVLAGEGLCRTYRLGSTLVPALKGVDVEILRGDFLVLQGPSGSGKSTLINLLGLLDRADAGRVLLDGQGVNGMDEEGLADLRRDRIGFVFQNFNLIPVLTAAENVSYPMTLKGLPADEVKRRTRDLLEAVGLAQRADARPDLLSGGERQRVAIARAVANAPEVIFADEPTACLDTGTAAQVLDLMRALNEQRGTAFVIATHDPHVVARARRAIALQDGRIMEGP
jgi:putative ABC transport system ATP-binding protein